MSEVYAITDLNGYASQMREFVAKCISDSYKNDDLNSYINMDQMINLIKSECLGFDDENRPLLNEESNDNIFEKTSVWIYNAGLSKLASKGFVECAWDDEKNEMIFWPSSSEKSNESKTNTRRKNTKDKRSNS